MSAVIKIERMFELMNRMGLITFDEYIELTNDRSKFYYQWAKE